MNSPLGGFVVVLLGGGFFHAKLKGGVVGGESILREAVGGFDIILVAVCPVEQDFAPVVGDGVFGVSGVSAL